MMTDKFILDNTIIALADSASTPSTTTPENSFINIHSAASKPALPHTEIEREKEIWDLLTQSPIDENDADKLKRKAASAALFENFEKIDKQAYLQIKANLLIANAAAATALTNINNCIENHTTENIVATDKTAVLELYTKIANDVNIYIQEREAALKQARKQTLITLEEVLLEITQDQHGVKTVERDTLFKIMDDLSAEDLYQKISEIDTSKTTDPLNLILMTFNDHLTSQYATNENTLKGHFTALVSTSTATSLKATNMWTPTKKAGPVQVLNLAYFTEVTNQKTKAPTNKAEEKLAKAAGIEHAAFHYMRVQALNETFGNSISKFTDFDYKRLTGITDPDERQAMAQKFTALLNEKIATYKQQRDNLLQIINPAIKQYILNPANLGPDINLKNLSEAVKTALITAGVDATLANTIAIEHIQNRYNNRAPFDTTTVYNKPAMVDYNSKKTEAIQKAKADKQAAYVQVAKIDEEYSREGAKVREEAVRGKVWVSKVETQEQTKIRVQRSLRQAATLHADAMNKKAANTTQIAQQILYDDYKNKQALAAQVKNLDGWFKFLGKPAARGFAGFTSLTTTMTLITVILSLTGWTFVAAPFLIMMTALAFTYVILGQGLIDFHDWNKNVQRWIKIAAPLFFLSLAVGAVFVFGFTLWPLVASGAVIIALAAGSYYYFTLNKNALSYLPGDRAKHKLIFFGIMITITCGIGLFLGLNPGIWVGAIVGFAAGYVINYYLQRFSIADALKKKFGTADKHGIIRYYQGYKNTNNLNNNQLKALMISICLNVVLATLYASIGYSKISALTEGAAALTTIPWLGDTYAVITQGAAAASFLMIFVGYLLLTTGPMAAAIKLAGNMLNNVRDYLNNKNNMRTDFSFRKSFMNTVWHNGFKKAIKSSAGYDALAATKTTPYTGWQKLGVCIGVVLGLPFILFTGIGWAWKGDPSASFWFKLDHYVARAPWVFIKKCIVATAVLAFLPLAILGCAALLLMSGGSFADIMRGWADVDKNYVDQNNPDEKIKGDTSQSIELAGQVVAALGIVIKAPLVAKSCVETIANYTKEDPYLNSRIETLKKKAQEVDTLIQQINALVGSSTNTSAQDYTQRYLAAAKDPQNNDSFSKWGFLMVRVANALMNAELASDYILESFEKEDNDDDDLVDDKKDDAALLNLMIFSGAFSQSVVLAEIGRRASSQEKLEEMTARINTWIKKGNAQLLKHYVSDTSKTATVTPLTDAFKKSVNKYGKDTYVLDLSNYIAPKTAKI